MTFCQRQAESAVTTKSSTHQKPNPNIFCFLRRVAENNRMSQVKQLSITFKPQNDVKARHADNIAG